MKYYYNCNGKIAKMLISGNCAIVMAEYKTMFFEDITIADLYLKGLGFYKK